MLTTYERRQIEIDRYEEMDNDLDYAQSQLDAVDVRMTDDSTLPELIVFELRLTTAIVVVRRHTDNEFKIIDGGVICANRDTLRRELAEALDDVRDAKADCIAATQRQLDRLTYECEFVA